MVNLIPIKYHNKKYPAHIEPSICEIAGHFDVENISPPANYSLHTEYSYGRRNFTSKLLANLQSIKTANRFGVPQLWIDEEWGIQFFHFVTALVKDKPPKLIEIHPPFSDYCPTIHQFLRHYKIFEERVLSAWPHLLVLLENRHGTMYRGGKFLISSEADIITLAEKIDKASLSLKITIDLPQILSLHGDTYNLNEHDIKKIISYLCQARDKIYGIHLWGKKKNASGRLTSHVGDLNTYFGNNLNKKSVFLRSIRELFDDNITRYFVPEVNSGNEDLVSIISDLEAAGFNFRK